MECISKRLQFEEITFKSEWYYYNSITGFYYKSGFIPGELFYSEISGKLSFYDISKIEQTLCAIYNEAQFNDCDYFRIVDYSRAEGEDLVSRKAYVDMINRANNKFNCAPMQTWICGADELIRISVILMSSATNQRLHFANSVQDALLSINSESSVSEITNNTMRFDQSDIYQISTLFNNLIFDQMYPSSYPFSENLSKQQLQLTATVDMTDDNSTDFYRLEKLDYDSILTILEAVQAGVIIVDSSNSQIVFCNQAAAHLSHTTPDKLLGKACTTLCTRNPSSCPLLAVKDKSIDKLETLLRCSDGMQIPIIKSAKKLIYNGKPYFLETFIDIKERKIAENELKKDAKGYLFDQSALKEFECKLYEERQRLANVIEGANIGTWELNVQTGETIVNERWAEILGYTLADISPVAIKRWSLLLHPEDLPRMNEALDSHLSGKTSIYDIEYRMMHKDGRWIWMHARGKLLAKTVDGKPLYMNGTHTDITVRKQYEKAIQENNDFLEDVFHSIQDGVFVLNEDFTIRHQNNIMKSWYHDCGSFSGKKCHVLFHNSDTPCDGCPTIRCFESKKTETAILTGRKNSNTKWVEAYSYPLKNRESGEITGAIVLIRDITKRKCDEEHLRKTNLLLEKQTALANSMADQARKASEAKSEFLANMSHEIRTPMNGLIGMTSLLFETPLNEEQFKYLEIIRSCGNSLLTLINDILDFSKIEAGRLEIESIDFDLCVLIKNFTEMISQRVHEKKLEFILDLSPDIPCLLNGDPHRFQQVLTNLVGNALKFTQEGEIIVKGEIVKDSENEAILKFSIQDSGIGIPAEKQKILFNKFTQVDNSPTRRYGGTGLGLAISKQLVTLMGGEIGIISPIIDQGSHHSESPHGSEFWFTSTFKKQSIQKTCLPKSIHFDNFSVLVIDENQAFRHNLKKILNSWNITVTETSSIYDAVFLMQKSLTDQVNYDIIFINQTASSSLSVSQIQQHFKTSYPNFKSNIVLVASSLHDLDTSGFSAVLQKPVFPDVLFSHVNQFVNHITGTPHEIHQRHSTGDIPFKNARILLVEDNIVNQKVAVGIMNKWNLSVDTAMNGLEALNALSRKKYDLVFMDVQMPELDGFETTKKIRDGENNVLDQTVPVIAMTAHTMCGDKEECISAGMNDYIPKPFNVDQLFAVLNKWLCSNSKGDSSSINNKK